MVEERNLILLSEDYCSSDDKVKREEDLSLDSVDDTPLESSLRES